MVALLPETHESTSPVPQQLARYWTKRRIQCLELLLAGHYDAEVARQCSRSRDWVQLQKANPIFKARVDSIKAQQLDDITRYGFGNKGNRLASMDYATRELDSRIHEGVTQVERRYDKDGNLLAEIERIDKDLLAEARQYHHALAEELGQLPRAGDTAPGNVVLIREINVHIER